MQNAPFRAIDQPWHFGEAALRDVWHCPKFIVMSSEKADFPGLLHRAAILAEAGFDHARYSLYRAIGANTPKQIAAYIGHDDGRYLHVSGRVLSNAPYGGPLDEDGWWENLLNTWRRWESDEVPGASVTLRFHDEEQTVEADDEGYYHATFASRGQPRSAIGWQGVEAIASGKDGNVTARHHILVVPADAVYGIISDIDDTVLHTGLTSMLLAAKLTFLENAKTRKPLDGVAKLYQKLQSGLSAEPVNPLFYVSSSPWNIHDLLVDFLRLNEIPVGPIFLRDLGIDRTKFIKTEGHGHKQDRVLALLDSYPALPFVLIGDSGQEDPAIYATVASLRPGHVIAIYIRDVDPDRGSLLDEAVHEAIALAATAGVPMILAPDSRAMAEHACSLGLIPAEAEKSVEREVHRDEARPETGEQAVQDAVESIFPE
jgi:phosphatidate phosphatase APP1